MLKTTRDTSPGEDNISYNMLKNVPEMFLSTVAALYSKSMTARILPRSMRTDQIESIPKKNVVRECVGW